MALLVVPWYDLICYAILVAAISSSVWIIIMTEANRHHKDLTKYNSLLITNEPRLTATGVVGSAQLWTTCWHGLHPGWLLVLRALAFVSLVGVLAWDIWIYDWSIMFYYTEWTFALVIIYFAIATAISAHGCWIHSKQQVVENEEANGFLVRDIERNSPATLNVRRDKNNDAIRSESHHEQKASEKRAGFWGYTMQIVYQTSAGAVMLTDVVFWGLLVPILTSKEFSLNLITGCMHSLNAIFLLLDTALNNLPFPWFRMAYFVLWSSIYVVFQWVLHACGFNWWPYPFLELATPWAPLWYFGMALVHIPCYVFYWLIVKAKNTLFPKFFSGAYIKSY